MCILVSINMPEAFNLSLGYIAGLSLSITEDQPSSKSSLYALDLAHYTFLYCYTLNWTENEN